MTGLGRRDDGAWGWSEVARLTALAAVAGLLLAALGPFGTYSSLDAAQRLLFWEVVLLGAAGLHIPSLWLAGRIGAAYHVTRIVWISAAVLLAALPTALLVKVIIATAYDPPRPPDFWRVLGFVLPISGPMQVLSHGIQSRPWRTERPGPRRGPRTGEDAPPPTTPVRTPLICRRLPAHLGGDVACLEMQDHYVRIHTALGSALVHMRMTDAEREAAGIEGLRVHRSWWVARAAVDKPVRRGRSCHLLLSNGLDVPVSRQRLPELQAAGWLGGEAL